MKIFLCILAFLLTMREAFCTEDLPEEKAKTLVQKNMHVLRIDSYIDKRSFFNIDFSEILKKEKDKKDLSLSSAVIKYAMEHILKECEYSGSLIIRNGLFLTNLSGLNDFSKTTTFLHVENCSNLQDLSSLHEMAFPPALTLHFVNCPSLKEDQILTLSQTLKNASVWLLNKNYEKGYKNGRELPQIYEKK